MDNLDPSEQQMGEPEPYMGKLRGSPYWDWFRLSMKEPEEARRGMEAAKRMIRAQEKLEAQLNVSIYEATIEDTSRLNMDVYADVAGIINSLDWDADHAFTAACKGIDTRLQSPNPSVQYLALFLLEFCMRACGEGFRSGFASSALFKITLHHRMLYDRHTNPDIKSFILALVQKWAYEVDHRKFKELFDKLMQAQYVFPPRSSAVEEVGIAALEGNAAPPVLHRLVGYPSLFYQQSLLCSRLGVAPRSDYRPPAAASSPPAPPDLDIASHVLSSVPNARISSNAVMDWISSRVSQLSDPSNGGSDSSGALDLTALVPDHVKHLEFQISDVHFVKPLGDGSFGKVYLAEMLHAPVAIKVLIDTAALAQSPDAAMEDVAMISKSSLINEVAVMAALRHPNVANIVGFCLEPPALTMEYYGRGSLYDILKSAARNSAAAAQLHWKRRLSLATQAAAGMLHLHTRSPQILHRDLKSANVMVAADWTVKIADMGLSKLADDAIRSVSSTGGPTNPRWLAPEVLLGNDATRASDVFSFGYILHELLTWKLPWTGVNMYAIGTKVAAGERPELPSPAELPGFGPEGPPDSLDDYLDLLGRCWAQEPSDRPDFAEIASELRRLMAESQ